MPGMFARAKVFTEGRHAKWTLYWAAQYLGSRHPFVSKMAWWYNSHQYLTQKQVDTLFALIKPYLINLSPTIAHADVAPPEYAPTLGGRHV